MLVATFNCNSVRQRLDQILDWLLVHEPDVLALQETKVVDEQFPKGAFEAAGWHVTFRGEKSYNGVAMVTREKPSAASFGLGDDNGESETRLAYVRVRGVHVVNTYVPQGQALDSPQFQLKLAWLRRLRKFLDASFNPKRQKVVWVGDVNVAPLPIDVHDSKRIWPHVCHCQEVVDAFDEVVSWGFEDIFRKHLPKANNYTFWDYRMRDSVEKNRGWRIDHVLATPPLAKRSEKVIIDVKARKVDKPSDHTFVTARFG